MEGPTKNRISGGQLGQKEAVLGSKRPVVCRDRERKREREKERERERERKKETEREREREREGEFLTQHNKKSLQACVEGLCLPCSSAEEHRAL